MQRHLVAYLMLACAWVLWLEKQKVAPEVGSKFYTIIQGFEGASACQSEMKRGVNAFKPKPSPQEEQPATGPLTPEQMELLLDLERKRLGTQVQSVRYDERLLCLPDTIDQRQPKP